MIKCVTQVVSPDKLPKGGQDSIHRVLFNSKGEAKTLLRLIKAARGARRSSGSWNRCPTFFSG